MTTLKVDVEAQPGRGFTVIIVAVEEEAQMVGGTDELGGSIFCKRRILKYLYTNRKEIF